jgi:hypothetical protein
MSLDLYAKICKRMTECIEVGSAEMQASAARLIDATRGPDG